MTPEDVASGRPPVQAGHPRQATGSRLSAGPSPAPASPPAGPAGEGHPVAACAGCGKPFEDWQRRTRADDGRGPLHGGCNPDAIRHERECLFARAGQGALW